MYHFGCLIAFIGVFSSIASASPLVHDGDLSRVPQGATSKDVITIIGAPIDQVERETKRQMVWYYAQGSVVFVGGRARSVYLKGSDNDKFREEEKKKMETQAIAANAKPQSPVEDILTEILREVPSEPGSEGAAELKSLEIQR